MPSVPTLHPPSNQTPQRSCRQTISTITPPNTTTPQPSQKTPASDVREKGGSGLYKQLSDTRGDLELLTPRLYHPYPTSQATRTLSMARYPL
ncbi:hypothetical protein K523DRAFT_359074 [Schizophyllum commune Tattone D]|nr:hypothetical protein K523DRAFT_359074 [Schizophyllum commune Tattone D]